MGSSTSLCGDHTHSRGGAPGDSSTHTSLGIPEQPPQVPAGFTAQREERQRRLLFDHQLLTSPPGPAHEHMGPAP